MPRVEIVQKHNAAARRLYIRGHNGECDLLHSGLKSEKKCNVGKSHCLHFKGLNSNYFFEKDPH